MSRGSGSFSKVGAQFTFLSLSRPIFDWFSKFFFPLKAYENCHLAKKWLHSCAPCAPASTAPEWYMCTNGTIYFHILIVQSVTKSVWIDLQWTLVKFQVNLSFVRHWLNKIIERRFVVGKDCIFSNNKSFLKPNRQLLLSFTDLFSADRRPAEAHCY